jgi:hypothetical protein
MLQRAGIVLLSINRAWCAVVNDGANTMNLTSCGICKGIKHVDAACHFCGSIRVGHKHYNVITLREVVKPKTSIVHRAEVILYNRRQNDANNDTVVRLRSRVNNSES